MPSKIYSLGLDHKNSITPQMGLLIDVRKYIPMNPHSNLRYHSKTGLDPETITWFWKHGDMQARLDRLQLAINDYAGEVYFHCTGGIHRSVFAAEYFGKFYNCPVEHIALRSLGVWP